MTRAVVRRRGQRARRRARAAGRGLRGCAERQRRREPRRAREPEERTKAKRLTCIAKGLREVAEDRRSGPCAHGTARRLPSGAAGSAVLSSRSFSSIVRAASSKSSLPLVFTGSLRTCQMTMLRPTLHLEDDAERRASPTRDDGRDVPALGRRTGRAARRTCRRLGPCSGPSRPPSTPLACPSSGRALPASSANGSVLAMRFAMSESCVFGGGGRAGIGLLRPGSSREATICFFGAVRAAARSDRGASSGRCGLPSLRSDAWMTGRATSGFSSSLGERSATRPSRRTAPPRATCSASSHDDAEDDLVRRVARRVGDAGQLHLTSARNSTPRC